ncbi:hypothetical protein ACQPYE_01020 [Actinosynnema sp. CA-299493]
MSTPAPTPASTASVKINAARSPSSGAGWEASDSVVSGVGIRHSWSWAGW